jgi:hypothetical protein
MGWRPGSATPPRSGSAGSPWAAAANFGVAPRFKFRLHPLDQIVGGLLLPATPAVLAGFVAEAQAAPEELSTTANMMPAPPLPFVPATSTAGWSSWPPLPTPVTSRPVPYPQIYPPEEEGFHPTAASRTLLVDAVDRDGTEAIVEHLAASTAPMRVAQLRVLGGAMARVPAQATAFAHRVRPPRESAHGERDRDLRTPRGGGGPPGLGRPLGHGAPQR